MHPPYSALFYENLLLFKIFIVPFDYKLITPLNIILYSKKILKPPFPSST